MSDLNKLSKLMAQELNGTPQWQWADYIKRRLEKLIREGLPECTSETASDNNGPEDAA
jgi:hypothetical protein